MKKLLGIFFTIVFAMILQVTPLQANAPAILPQLPNGGVYRFWSPVYQKHFMTMTYSEASYIYRSDPAWQYEGEVFRAFTMTDNPTIDNCNQEFSPIGGACEKICSEGELVFRFLGQNRAFFYAFFDEAQLLFNTNPYWTYEGPVFCALDVQDSNVNTINVYRYFNADLTTHVFTISDAERASINANPAWQIEGIAFAVKAPPTPISKQDYADDIVNLFVEVDSKRPVVDENKTIEERLEEYEDALSTALEAMSTLEDMYVPEGADYIHGIAEEAFLLMSGHSSQVITVLNDPTLIDAADLNTEINNLTRQFEGQYEELVREFGIALIELINY